MVGSQVEPYSNTFWFERFSQVAENHRENHKMSSYTGFRNIIIASLLYILFKCQMWWACKPESKVSPHIHDCCIFLKSHNGGQGPFNLFSFILFLSYSWIDVTCAVFLFTDIIFEKYSKHRKCKLCIINKRNIFLEIERSHTHFLHWGWHNTVV